MDHHEVWGCTRVISYSLRPQLIRRRCRVLEAGWLCDADCIGPVCRRWLQHDLDDRQGGSHITIHGVML